MRTGSKYEEVIRTSYSFSFYVTLSFLLQKGGVFRKTLFLHFFRKEVFQPHLPVRLPCYDLAPITSFTLGRPLRSQTSGAPGFHGLTGGVYKARERIHRAMADARFSESSFMGSGCRPQSELRRILMIRPLLPATDSLYAPL